MIIDSHCHLDRLDLEKYQGNIHLALDGARQAGVERFLSVCVDLSEFPNILSLTEKHSDIDCSVGVHPTDGENHAVELDKLVNLASHPKVVALGETGLDYYRSASEVHLQQQTNFRTHIQASHKLNKPLIIHTRQAQEDTLRILKEENAEQVSGVMHCFTETWEWAKQFMDINFYISISGIVTFKNANSIREVALNVPLDRLLIETDSPYLAPVPERGKPNEPAYVRYVAEFVAQLRGISFEKLAESTTNNYYRLFHKR